tara:strand:- start:3003 stop:3941 length:939 start_codon:yes stop_codon:yes gene_type:complete
MRTLFFFIILLIVLHCKYNKYTNNQYSILQIDGSTISKNKLEEYFRQKLPLVITSIGKQWSELMRLTPTYIYKYCTNYRVKIHTSIKEQQATRIKTVTMREFIIFHVNGQTQKNIQQNKQQQKQSQFGYISNDSSFLKDYGLVQLLERYASDLLPPLTLIKSYLFSMGPKETKIGLQYETNMRNIIYLIYGKIKIILFSPKYSKYLYKSNRYDNEAVLSAVHFWNPNTGKYPLFKKAQYIEIILYPGQLFYIPAYWWYAIEFQDTSVFITMKANNVFSSIERIPNIVSSLYHLGGKYKTNNCTCHNSPTGTK